MLGGLFDRYFIKQPRLRRTVTKIIYGSDDATVELLGARITINKLRENGYWRAYRLGRSSSLLRDELPVLLNLSHFARPGGAFVDAGANIGVYSAFFSRFKKLFDRFEVHAFEPTADTFSRLQKNADALGFRAYQVALAAAPGKLRMVQGAVSHVTTLADAPNAYSMPGTEFEIAALRLDSIEIDSSEIVLKIDVEGQEHSVLAGAQRLFEERRVRAVYCDGWSSPEVPRFLKGYGFDLHDGRTFERPETPSWSLLAVRP